MIRVHFNRKAYADLTAHAKESVEAEVGGVLVGEVKEDGDDFRVEVKAIIRAMAAREKRAQITFTHDTWTQIHKALDREYPNLQIVGWYHTHPGFGVEFSAMDKFIQENFFSGKTQIAFLTDPLGGDTAILCNGANGLEPLAKFWVDGREHKTRLTAPPAASESARPAAHSDTSEAIERLESRVNHLIQALDETRANFHRTLLTILAVACAGIAAWVGYAIWSDRMDRMEPPRVQSYVPVPVRVGNETVMIGVGIVDWKIPPSLDAMMQKLAEAEIAERKKIEEQRAKERAKQQKKAK
jgi:proteasome lid subunit RPN8/RPN11